MANDLIREAQRKINALELALAQDYRNKDNIDPLVYNALRSYRQERIIELQREIQDCIAPYLNRGKV